MVHYRGRLLDGTEFDSSYRRGEPAEFMVGGVIRWQEAHPGDAERVRCEVWIPAALAYGERGAGGAIGPNRPCTSKSSHRGQAGGLSRPGQADPDPDPDPAESGRGLVSVM